MSDPLLFAEAARIDADGAPLLEATSFGAHGPRVVLVGDFHPLFLLLAGKARLAAGRVQILGHPAERAAADGIVGLALAEATLPPRFEAGQYLTESAALLGIGRGVAKSAARAALTKLHQEHLWNRRIETLTLAEQRAVTIAHAGLGAPPVLALETPFEGIHDERALSWLAELLAVATHGHALLVSMTSLPHSGPERALADQADTVLQLRGGALVTADAGTAAGRYTVTVLENADEFCAQLTAAGARVTPSGTGLGPAAPAAAAVAEGAQRLLVELPSTGSTQLILAAADDADAPLLELIPVTFESGINPA